MSLRFNWPEFNEEFYAFAKLHIAKALNDIKNDVISDIEVNDLFMGSQPPHAEIIEISSLELQRIKGILKVSYSGDAFIQIKAKVQINPLSRLHHQQQHSLLRTGARAAYKPLVLPLALTISQLELDAIMSVAYSKQNGLTVNFKNDPLQGLKITSTFDELGVNELITKEITERIRSTLCDVLPVVLHQLSLGWNKNYSTSGASQSDNMKQKSEVTSPLSSSQSPQLSSMNVLPLREKKLRHVRKDGNDSASNYSGSVHSATVFGLGSAKKMLPLPSISNLQTQTQTGIAYASSVPNLARKSVAVQNNHQRKPSLSINTDLGAFSVAGIGLASATPSVLANASSNAKTRNSRIITRDMSPLE
ncbi:hypothetical protein MIR68_004893 [Amoeboaphelidium protococcarum]|nr:hypothetical protein MIR68_004893 [Amoeboaphelidium protococcarum]